LALAFCDSVLRTTALELEEEEAPLEADDASASGAAGGTRKILVLFPPEAYAPKVVSKITTKAANKHLAQVGNAILKTTTWQLAQMWVYLYLFPR
jgi:hypothetical protein